MSKVWIDWEIDFFHRRWKGWSRIIWWAWPIRWYCITEHENGNKSYSAGLTANDCAIELGRIMKEDGREQGIEEMRRVWNDHEERLTAKEESDPQDKLEIAVDALEFYAKSDKPEVATKALKTIQNHNPETSWEEYRKTRGQD